MVERRVSLLVRLLLRDLRKGRHLWTVHLKLLRLLNTKRRTCPLRLLWIQMSVMLQVIISSNYWEQSLVTKRRCLEIFYSSFSLFCCSSTFTRTDYSLRSQFDLWSGACRPRKLRRDHEDPQGEPGQTPGDVWVWDNRGAEETVISAW